MKKLLLLTMLAISFFARSQSFSINTDGSVADTSAILDVKSVNKGLLIPRMTLVQRNSIYLPATGLIIYQTDNTPGFYYNSGTPASPTWVIISTGSGGSYWAASGDDIYNTNSGNVGIGITNPRASLGFSGSLGQKISLWDDGNAGGGNYGFGIQAGVLQMYCYTPSDNIAFGYGSSSSFTERMRIKATGNVGIGTTNPVARFHVADSSVVFTATILVLV